MHQATIKPKQYNRIKKSPETRDISLFDNYEKLFHAWLGKMTMGLSPISFHLAYQDFLEHLILSPAKQMEMGYNACKGFLEWQHFIASNISKKEPRLNLKPDLMDRRFKDKSWKEFPYNAYEQAFLVYRKWLIDSITSVRGVDTHHLNLLLFNLKQLIDGISPSNFIATNPLLTKATNEQAGLNLVTGWYNFLEDMRRYVNHEQPIGTEQYLVGKNLAITKGKVIFRNYLMELIQYEATTTNVYAEPILIVPAWIMKYYILDLSQHNSLVKYLVDKGHTVFIISWKNPTADHKNVGLNDYLSDALLEAIDIITNIVPQQKIHSVGYCLGGTLLAIAASYLGKRHNHPLKSVTLFTAQTDFEEAGELQYFIDESELRFLEDLMQTQGYLDKQQMKGMFQWLRSNELVWSNMVSNYLMGERAVHNDLMAWNADATRMPYKMHSEYLRKLLHNNELARGQYKVENTKLALTNIDVPIFAVGTKWDHIAPWKSVYKINLLTNTEVTFVLTNGGHNAGIVNEPGHPKRSYQIATSKKSAPYISSGKWQKTTKIHEGSWWPAWQKWLAAHSSEEQVPAKKTGSHKYRSICDAPGKYVMEK